MNRYRSLRNLSIFIAVLFVLIIAIEVVYMVGSVYMIALPDMTIASQSGPLNYGLFAIGLASIIGIIVRVVLIAAFLIFVYRGFSNLRMLGIYRTEFSPGWAVGWWLIPIANFWMPFRVMRELWKASDPAIELDRNSVPPDSSAPETILFWWLAFTAGSVLGRIADRMLATNHIKYFPVAELVSAILLAASAALAIGIVRGIADRQDRRSLRFLSDGPPPPPEFEESIGAA